MRKKPYFLALTTLLAALMLTLGSCGQKVKISEQSPAIKDYTVSVSNKGTENSQVVRISIAFDRPVKVTAAAHEGLHITLNGKTPDKKTMDYRVLADPSDKSRMIVELYALKSDTDPAKGRYFALYEGNLSLSGAKKNGALLGVTDASGKYTVVLSRFQCFVPSGLGLQTLSSVAGDAAHGVKAKTVIKVADTAKVRVITWLSLLSTGKPVLAKTADTTGYGVPGGYFPLHAHEFLKYPAHEYAALMAEALEKYYGKGTATQGGYTFTVDNDTIIIEATAPVNGETLTLGQSPLTPDQNRVGEKS